MTTNILEKAKTQLVLRHPFYAALMLSLPLVESDEIPTAATDGSQVIYNPQFMAQLNMNEQMFVLAHELEHIVRLHSFRLMGRNRMKFNHAADYIINGDLQKAGFTLPRKEIIQVLYDPAYAGEYTESLYAKLPDPDDGQAQGSGSSSGQGTPKLHDDIQPAKGDAAAQQHAQQQIQQKVHQAAAAARQAGNMPAHLQKLLDALVEPVVAWQDVLRRYLTSVIRAGESWSRLDRRMMGRGYRLPSHRQDALGEVAVVIDVSGSCWHMIPQFVSEIAAIVTQAPPTRLHILWTDTRVMRHDIIEPDDYTSIEARVKNIEQGGGTDLRSAFSYMRQHDISPIVTVGLTDGETPWGDAPDHDVLWVIDGAEVAPWGETIHI